MIPKSLITQFKNQQLVCHYKSLLPTSLTICFIPGFRSSGMTSKKSVAVYQYCVGRNLNFLSWNHTDQGTVQDWYEQGLCIINRFVKDDEEIILVGSSMGLWLSLLIASQRNANGVIGIGGGVDFTERWLMNEVPKEKRNDLTYIWKRKTEYTQEGYYEIPVSFLIGSRPALIYQQKRLKLECPVRLLHGSDDKDVVFERSIELLKYLKKSNVDVSLDEIKGGDHRLSSCDHLDIIINKIDTLVQQQSL